MLLPDDIRDLAGRTINFLKKAGIWRLFPIINYLINYRNSYYVQFGQTRVFLIALCEHSKAAAGRLERPRCGLSLWCQSNRTLGSIGKPVTG